MGERARPSLFTIPAHRAFADALVTGLLAQHRGDPMALAQGMVLLPNNRAIRAVRDAFVRQSGGGLLLPRLVAIGDPDLGEQVGGALDPLGEEAPIPPAVAPMRRQMMLARMVQDVRPDIDAGQALQLAQALGAVLDQMQVERVPLRALRELDLSADLSRHWQVSLTLFEILIARWPDELARIGCIDLADRRNRLFDRLADRWGAHPPPGFVAAAGISTTAPAVAPLLRRVSEMPRGLVVFAGLDQHMDADAWDAIGPFDPDPVTGQRPPGHESHPQYALKRLLDRQLADCASAGLCEESALESKPGFDTMARISPVVGSVTTAEARTPSGSASYARRCSSGSIVSSTSPGTTLREGSMTLKSPTVKRAAPSESAMTSSRMRCINRVAASSGSCR